MFNYFSHFVNYLICLLPNKLKMYFYLIIIKNNILISKSFLIGNSRQHQDGVDDRLPPPTQRSNQYQYNRSSGQGNLSRERRGGGGGGNSNSAPRGNRGGGNRRMDDRRRTADDEHTILDNAQDSGDRGKNINS